MLTVFCWLWSQPGGRTVYTADHVNIWADMVRRHLTLPHRISCVTDMPEGVDSSIGIIDPPHDFDGIRIPTWGDEKPQCLRRVAMFRPDAASIFGDRFVSMDMDCIISGSLDPLFDRTDDIVLYESPPGSPAPVRPYNGSMVMMSAGARPDVYERFTAAGAIEAGKVYQGSDQAWISYALGAGEATWGEADGVVWWGRWTEGLPARLCFFPGSPKPWELLGRYEWADRHYRKRRGGRCLVLGYGSTVWADASAALGAGAVDAVIASPEAAEHWPGDVLAVARSDDHADELASIYGFDQIAWCGRTKER